MGGGKWLKRGGGWLKRGGRGLVNIESIWLGLVSVNISSIEVISSILLYGY